MPRVSDDMQGRQPLESRRLRISMVLRFLLAAIVATILIDGFVLVDGAIGQTVTFEPPEEIQIAPGRLSVTFAAGVSQASAEAVLKELGLEILETRFGDVTVVANADDPFTDREVASLTAHPRVLEVERFSVAVAPEHYVHVRFSADTDPEEAEWVVSQWRKSASVSVRSIPNEILISVRPGREEEAIGVLESREAVQSVTYVAGD